MKVLTHQEVLTGWGGWGWRGGVCPTKPGVIEKDLQQHSGKVEENRVPLLRQKRSESRRLKGCSDLKHFGILQSEMDKDTKSWGGGGGMSCIHTA